MAKSAPSYWFPAKRYGWGWGAPQNWQGWAVLLAFFALLALNAIVFSPVDRPLAFTALTVVLCVVLVLVCYAKGEPPRWRWGDKQ